MQWIFPLFCFQETFQGKQGERFCLHDILVSPKINNSFEKGNLHSREMLCIRKRSKGCQQTISLYFPDSLVEEKLGTESLKLDLPKFACSLQGIHHINYNYYCRTINLKFLFIVRHKFSAVIHCPADYSESIYIFIKGDVEYTLKNLKPDTWDCHLTSTFLHLQQFKFYNKRKI